MEQDGIDQVAPPPATVADLAAGFAGFTDDDIYANRLSDEVFRWVERYDSSLRDLWFALAIDESVTQVTAFAGLLGATTIDRRRREYSRFIEAMSHPRVRRRFADWPPYEMMMAESLMYQASFGVPGLLVRARDRCMAYLRYFEDAHGAQNLLVEICLHLLANSSKTNESVLELAETANQRAIALSAGSNAKYLAHRGLLRAYRGDLASALADIQTAIDNESAGKWDYAARIAHYEAVAARAESICLRVQLNQDVEEARREIESARGQVLTMTALFAAIVAVVVVNVSVASKLEDHVAAIALSMTGTGTVIVAFGLLITLVLPPRTRPAWVLAIVVPVVGVCLIALGLGLPALAR